MSRENREVNSVDFYHDFIVFLQYLEKRPIKLTATGRISLHDVNQLLGKFNLGDTRDIISIYKEAGWKICSEENIEALTQIKLIADFLNLTYKWKKQIILSKKGKAFLEDFSPVEQYQNMVLGFWQRVNWGYFSPSREINDLNVAEVLQNNQEIIWQLFLQKGRKWIDFPAFCQVLKLYFHLGPYYEEDSSGDYSLYLDVTYGLVKRNLLRFGCLEVEEKKDKHGLEEIRRIKPTNLGLFMFTKALSQLSHDGYWDT